MRTMTGRLLIAFVGASAITLGLLFGMNEIVEIFRVRDSTQYFGVTDVLLRPDDARPRRIPRAAEQPERGTVEFERPDVSVDIERPSVDVDETREGPRIRPRLEERAPDD